MKKRKKAIKSKKNLKKRIGTKIIKKKIKKTSSPRKKARSKKIKKKAVKVLSENGISMEKIGEVTHYFPKVNAAAVKILKNSVRIGDYVYLKGHTTDFKEKVDSIQLDHNVVSEGKKGQEIGLAVSSRVRIGDGLYKIKSI